MAVPRQKSLEKTETRYRSVSQTSCISMDSSISDILEEKVSFLSLELDYLRAYRNGLIDLQAVNPDIKKELLDEIKSSRKRMRPLESELVVLKRQKKIIQDDLDELLPTSQTMVDAYSSVLCHKVMSAWGKQKNRKFDQEAFRKGVLEFYETLKGSKEEVLKWCPVM